MNSPYLLPYFLTAIAVIILFTASLGVLIRRFTRRWAKSDSSLPTVIEPAGPRSAERSNVYVSRPWSRSEHPRRASCVNYSRAARQRRTGLRNMTILIR